MPSNTPELRNYYPSLRERTEQLVRDLLAGDTRPSAVQASQARGITEMLDFTPAGIAFGLDDAWRMGAAGVANASPRQIAGAIGLAALAVSPFAGKALRRPITHAAHYRRPFDPPDLPQRPFEADYPGPVRADARGTLTHDMDGEPLDGTRWLVGRQVVGGPDEAFPIGDLDELSKATTELGTHTMPARYMGNSLGIVDEDKYGRRFIALRAGLSKDRRRRIHTHELGHVIADLARELATIDLSKDKELARELSGIFNTQNNPLRGRGREALPWNTVTPEGFGYEGEDVAHEYWAEAIRANLTNPNYIKTRGPKVAETIRRVWRNSPYSEILRFNSALAPVAGAEVLFRPDDETPSEGAPRKIPKGGRVDASDPDASDGLSTEAWMKRRREQLGQPRR